VNWSVMTQNEYTGLKMRKYMSIIAVVTVMTAGCGAPSESGNEDTESGQAESTAMHESIAGVDGLRIQNANDEPHNWLSYGRTYSEQRYSPLDKINTANISELSLAWYLDLDTNRGQQATPLVVDGVMYSTSAWSKVQAVDAATGELIWQYDPEVPKAMDVKSCCGVQNRGAAIWKGRVYAAALDGRLSALDAETGKVVWQVQTTDRGKPYSITGAPRIVDGKVIIGNGGAEYGVRGYVTAYDAATGDQLWRFFTVPGNPADGFENDTMRMAAETWKGEWWKHGGGGTAWDSFAFDPELDLLYIGTGNGSPWPRELRSPGGGDNLFLSSIVAVRPDTGEYVWHYQTVPGDSWDYTAVQHMILADLEIAGEKRQVIMQAPKNGFFYVLDRATGELISAENIMPTNWATHIDMETGRPVETSFARYDETGIPVKIVPGPQGAHNWQPMSYSPDTGLVYIPVLQLPIVFNVNENFRHRNLGVNFGVAPWERREPQNEWGPEFGEDLQGHLLAWDPVEQKEAWRLPLPGAHEGGMLTTASNLLFQGNSDGELVAYNATTGERLWSGEAQSGITAAPMTYEVAGEQYVAVLAGWGSSAALVVGMLVNADGTKQNISRILAFKIGGKAELPPIPQISQPPEPPSDLGDDELVAKGRLLYAPNCTGCHGLNAVSGGVIPDLRYSATIADSEAFKQIVHDGALAENGMVSFAENLSEEDTEAVRAFLIRRANESWVAPN
jgi:alcohol dehydrogenase (cytochrome c)/quinohemoprotein ethanol dehydrogenase